MTPCYDEDLKQLCDVHYAHGTELVAMFEAYLDEAATDRSAPVMCVSGYLYRKGRRARLQRDWDQILKDTGINVVHMHELKNPECLKRLPGESAEKRKKRHDRLIRRLIRRIKANATEGIVVTLDQHRSFNSRVDNLFKSRFGGPQTMATVLCMTGIARWADCESFDGKIAYFFEEGSKEQGSIDCVLRTIASDTDLRRRFRLQSRSTFVPKDSTRAIQTADVLAWEIQKLERGRRGHESLRRRESMRQLANIHTRYLELDRFIVRIVQACSDYKSWEPELLMRLIPIGPPMSRYGLDGTL